MTESSRNHNRLKVAILGKLPPPYMGPSIATEILLSSSLGNQVDLYHVNTKAHDSLATLGRWSAGKVVRNARAYFGMAGVMWTVRPDVVLIPISQNTTGFLKDSVYILIARMMKRRTLLQLRGSNFRNWFDSRSWLLQRFTHAIVSSCQGMIVLGNNLRHLFEGFFPEERIHVVPNGANYPLIHPHTPIEYRTTLRILYLGNLQPTKGIEDVVEAARILREQGRSGFTIEVVGAWRDMRTRDAVESMVKKLGLPVRFHGAVVGDQKWTYLNEADVLVFPPRDPEGHPWVLVEALAAGIPVVATDQGAIVESVVDGVNGFIVAANSPEQIADRLNRLLDNEGLRIEMGRRSRIRYEEEFTEERMVERLLEALKQTASNDHAPDMKFHQLSRTT